MSKETGVKVVHSTGSQTKLVKPKGNAANGINHDASAGISSVKKVWSDDNYGNGNRPSSAPTEHNKEKSSQRKHRNDAPSQVQRMRLNRLQRTRVAPEVYNRAESDDDDMIYFSEGYPPPYRDTEPNPNQFYDSYPSTRLRRVRMSNLREPFSNADTFFH